MLPYINPPFVWLASKVGNSSDELKLIFSFLLSYPLAGLLKRIPDSRPDLKNLFIISSSLFYLIGLFDLWDGLRTLFISAAGAYTIAKYFRGSPYMPWMGFAFLMGHVSVNHIARQRTNAPEVVDITGAQMVMIIKLSAFCWNVADGALPATVPLTDLQRDRCLRELPGLLDYAAYVLFFPSLMAGPAFDYAEYRRWLDTTMFDTPRVTDATKKAPTRKKRRIPRSGTPATAKMVSGLLWLLLFVKAGPVFPPSLLLTERYAEYGFARRVIVMYLVNVTARLKFYAVWTLSEGACILAGLGYNGVDPVTGKVSWDRLTNIRPWGVETAQNSRAYLENWNMNTNHWLRNYVYLRVTPRGKKPGFRASLATFATSAFWHGFHPGYYMTFVLASLIQTVAKNFRRYLRPFFLDPKTQSPLPAKKYYDLVSYVATQLVFSFVTTPFLTLHLRDSLQAWGAVNYFAVVCTVVSMVFFVSPGRALLRRELDRRAARAGGPALFGAADKKAAAKARRKGDAPEPPPTDLLHRSPSTDSLASRAPVLGMPQDPEAELDEALGELRAEVQAARAEFMERRGSLGCGKRPKQQPGGAVGGGEAGKGAPIKGS